MNGLRNYFCKVCNKSCNSAEQLRLHKSSKAHINKCQRSTSECESEAPDYYAPFQVTPEPEEEDGFMVCSACQAQLSPGDMLGHFCDAQFFTNPPDPFRDSTFTGPQSQQPSSSSSGSQLKRPSLEPITTSASPFYCSLCKTELNSQGQYDMHMAGRRHLARKKEVAAFVEQVRT